MRFRNVFNATVDVLATHPGRINYRLFAACQGSFIALREIEMNMPQQFQPLYDAIRDKLTGPDTDDITTTIYEMSEAEAVDIARAITDLARRYETHLFNR